MLNISQPETNTSSEQLLFVVSFPSAGFNHGDEVVCREQVAVGAVCG